MFKAAFLLSTLMLTGLSAANATTDFFECHTHIQDLVNGSTLDSIDTVAGYRQPTPINENTGQPYPADISVTDSRVPLSFKLKSAGVTYSVDLDLHYGLAVRNTTSDDNARQYVCQQASLSRCVDGPGGSNGDCAGTGTICVVQPDPFDNTYGWSRTVTSNGQAVFNESALHPFSTTIPIDENHSQGALVVIDCKLQGTHN